MNIFHKAYLILLNTFERGAPYQDKGQSHVFSPELDKKLRTLLSIFPLEETSDVEIRKLGKDYIMVRLSSIMCCNGKVRKKSTNIFGHEVFGYMNSYVPRPSTQRMLLRERLRPSKKQLNEPL